jgi:hypothetical protein
MLKKRISVHSAVVSLFLLALLLALPATADAQFLVETSTPISGSDRVPLETTVRFEFNDRVSTTTNWNTAFVAEPRDAIEIRRANLVLDDQDRPAVVEYIVQHDTNTDFTWLVYAVESGSGEPMSTPYTLRYTTASNRGNRQVSGAVSVSSSASKTAGDDILDDFRTSKRPDRTTWRKLTSMAKQSGLGKPSFNVQSIRPATVAKGSSAPDYTSIFLLEKFVPSENKWTVRGGTVIDGDAGAFTVDYMRDDTYWPLAVRYSNHERTEIESVGFYDADGDGEPDPVTLSGANLENIDIQLYAFPRTTAQESLSDANGEANRYASDQELVHVEEGSGSTPAGTAHEWIYHYYSSSRDWETIVTVDPLGTEVSINTDPDFIRDMSPIQAGFVDSDVALQTVLDNGGQAFIEPYSLRSITTLMEGGNLFWLADAPTSNTFWRIQLIVSTSSGSELFERFIDAQTGEILDPTALPVELTSFTAQAADASSILLRWETASETNNAGFDVEHQVPGTSAFEPVAFVGGQGTTSRPNQYRHRVAGVTAGTHRFRLRQVDTDGTSTYSPEVEVQVMLDRPLVFEPPYPNPVRSRATVRFGTRDGGLVRVELYDALGRRVRTLHSGEAPSGDMHTHHVEVSGLSSGLYFLRLIGPSGETEVRSMTVVQ